MNAVVVGSGAGGGVVFSELARGRPERRVPREGPLALALRGPQGRPPNQRNSSLGVAYGPDEDKNPRVFVDLQGRERVVRPAPGRVPANASCVGGGTFSYGAQAWRFMPQDFRMRSTYGTVAGSTLDDWPIGYEDLEPYYEKAE